MQNEEKNGTKKRRANRARRKESLILNLQPRRRHALGKKEKEKKEKIYERDAT